jgi:hypothetical protein
MQIAGPLSSSQNHTWDWLAETDLFRDGHLKYTDMRGRRGLRVSPASFASAVALGA